MLVGSCAHTHQSELASPLAGTPPASVWKPLIAVPHRNPVGKSARAGTDVASTARPATIARNERLFIRGALLGVRDRNRPSRVRTSEFRAGLGSSCPHADRALANRKEGDTWRVGRP